MERAGRVLSKSKLAAQLSSEELAKRAWPAAVGKRIAVHTRATRLVRSCLVVEVEDWIWQKQLWTLRGQILRKVDAVLGTGIVSEIEFRVGIPRRLPRREERAVRDQTSSIEDPILSRLYEVARKRASA